MKYEVSVVMPALNEEEAIEAAIEDVAAAFRKTGCAGQILVINDGSTDRTPEIVRALIPKYPFLTLISHDRPQSIGGSFRHGVRESEGDVVVLIPGDGEIKSFEILRYLPLMDQVDMVIPFVFNQEVRSVTRRFISRLYTLIINISFGTRLNYTNGTVMYRKALLDELNLENTGFFYQTELLVKALKRGYLSAEVPYALKPRAGGTSKALTLKSLFKVMRGYTSLMRSVYLSPAPKQAFASSTRTAGRYAQLDATPAKSNKVHASHSPH